MKIVQAINPRWSDPEHSAIDCDLIVEGMTEKLPFTSHPDDTAAYSKDIYNYCLSGKAGEIGPHTPRFAPPLPKTAPSGFIPTTTLDHGIL